MKPLLRITSLGNLEMPSGASEPPGGTGLRQPSPPRVRKARPSGGPLLHASGPGWQERQVAKPVAIPGPRHIHCFTQMTGTDHNGRAPPICRVPHLLRRQRINLFLVATLFEDFFFSKAPHLLPSSRELHRRHEFGPPLHSTVSTQNFRNVECDPRLRVDALNFG